MTKAPVPANEEQRYLDLLSYHILDSEEEEDYTALIQLAAEICNCNSAAISFIDKERQWFKAKVNMPVPEGPRDVSFCGHVIMHNEVMVIDNASQDKRFADNPDVTGGLKIGFYAGAPIISSAGNKLGTVCVIDHQPKLASIDPKQKRSLEAIAAQVTKLLELRSKNKLIVEQANALLKAEKEMAKLNMSLREKENDHIAYQLHENIAQILAAAKMKLDVISEEKEYDDKELDNVKKYLSLVLNDVRSLSYSITPTTFAAADYNAYIFRLAVKAKEEKNISISFSPHFKTTAFREGVGLSVFRIFQNVIRYAELAGADKIKVNLQEEKSLLRISMEQNGIKTVNTEEGSMLINNIVTRAGLINAHFSANDHYRKMEISLNT